MRLQVQRSAPSGRGYIEVYFTGASPRATVYAPFGSIDTAHRKLVVTPLGLLVTASFIRQQYIKTFLYHNGKEECCLSVTVKKLTRRVHVQRDQDQRS